MTYFSQNNSLLPGGPIDFYHEAYSNLYLVWHEEIIYHTFMTIRDCLVVTLGLGSIPDEVNF
jgi:hypothetical protein